MSKNLTECDTVDKKTTQYIQRNITQRFIDTWVELSDRKVPPQLILQGLSIALAGFTIRVKETQGSENEIGQIIDDVVVILNKAIKNGVNFPAQAAALAILVQCVLGIKTENLE